MRHGGLDSRKAGPDHRFDWPELIHWSPLFPFPGGKLLRYLHRLRVLRPDREVHRRAAERVSVCNRHQRGRTAKQARGSMYPSRSHSSPSATGPTIRRKPPSVDVRIARSVGRQGRSHPRSGEARPTAPPATGRRPQEPRDGSISGALVPSASHHLDVGGPVRVHAADRHSGRQRVPVPELSVRPARRHSSARRTCARAVRRIQGPVGHVVVVVRGNDILDAVSRRCGQNVGKTRRGPLPSGETAPDQGRIGS